MLNEDEAKPIVLLREVENGDFDACRGLLCLRLKELSLESSSRVLRFSHHSPNACERSWGTLELGDRMGDENIDVDMACPSGEDGDMRTRAEATGDAK